MTEWGRKMFVTPGIVVDGKLLTTIWSRSISASGSCWALLLRELGRRDLREERPAGQSGGRASSLESTTIPKPQKRDFDDKYSWVMSPRWYDGTGTILRSTPAADRLRVYGSTALAGLVDIGYVKATGNSVKINLPKTATKPEVSLNGRSRSGAMPSSAIGRALISRPMPLPARCIFSNRR